MSARSADLSTSGWTATPPGRGFGLDLEQEGDDLRIDAATGWQNGASLMSMPWLQRRLFCCSACGEQLRHDEMHGHWAFKCPAQPKPKEKPAPVLVTKIYEPKAGR